MRGILALCVAFLACGQPARAPFALGQGSAMPAVDASPLPAATINLTSAIPTQEPINAPPPPKLVLHLGDSMVGGYGGLTRALEAKFKELGSHWVRDWQEGVGIGTFERGHRLDDLLTKHKPDLVILTLGANDVTLPFPAALAPNIKNLARKMSAGGRECYWTLPPLWRKDTGIIDTIKQNAAPCKVFDTGAMKIARARDGIHPNDQGGIEWADAFFAFYRNGAAPEPTASISTDAR